MICERCGGESGAYRKHPDVETCFVRLESENAELKAKLAHVSQLYGPYSTVEIALKAQEAMKARAEKAEADLTKEREFIDRKTKEYLDAMGGMNAHVAEVEAVSKANVLLRRNAEAQASADAAWGVSAMQVRLRKLEAVAAEAKNRKCECQRYETMGGKPINAPCALCLALSALDEKGESGG